MPPRTPGRPGTPRVGRTPRGGRTGRNGMMYGAGLRGAPWFQQLMWQRMMEQGGGDDDAAEEQQDALERALDDAEESSSSSGSTTTGQTVRRSGSPVSVGSSASKGSSSGGGYSGGSSGGGSSKKPATDEEPRALAIPNGPQQEAIEDLVTGGASVDAIKAAYPEFSDYIDAVASGSVDEGKPDSKELAKATADAATTAEQLSTGEQDPTTGDVLVTAEDETFPYTANTAEASEKASERQFGSNNWQTAKERTYEDTGVDLGIVDPATVEQDPEGAILDAFAPTALDPQVAGDEFGHGDPFARALAKVSTAVHEDQDAAFEQGYEDDPYADQHEEEDEDEDEDDEFYGVDGKKG